MRAPVKIVNPRSEDHRETMIRLGKLCGAHTVEYVDLDAGEEYLLTTGIIAEDNIRHFNLTILGNKIDGGFLHNIKEIVEETEVVRTVRKEF